jgi:alanine racemase
VTGPQLEIDLGAFAHNLDVVRARVAPTELMVVVKDDAYGHGVERIVRRAVEEGVSWFGAFDVQEALRTRAAAGDAARVFSWLTVGPDEIDAALDADIELGLGDLAFLDDIAAVALSTGRTARVHLKIDTGLHRNGIRPEDWDGVVAHARALQDAGAVRVVGVWSHIAEASDAEDDLARAVFEDALRTAQGAGLAIEVRHLAASAASFSRPEFRYDLARVGAFCYGIRSAGGPTERELGLRPVSRLTAPVEHVGDGSVTIALGSLHGLPSNLATRSSVRIAGERVPLLRIEAGHTTLGEWASAAPGERVVVFGAGGASATDLAETIDTVGEEILVRVSPLVPRVEDPG